MKRIRELVEGLVIAVGFVFLLAITLGRVSAKAGGLL